MTSSGYMTDKYPPHTPAPSLSSNMANTLCLAAVLIAAIAVPSLHATFGGHGKVVIQFSGDSSIVIKHSKSGLTANSDIY